MSKGTYVGRDVPLNSMAAVWGKPGEKPRSLLVPNTDEGLESLFGAVGKLLTVPNWSTSSAP